MAQQYYAATRKTNNWLSSRMTPAKVEGVKRGFRYFFYQIVGAVTVNAAALAAIALTHWTADPAVVTVGSWLTASVAAAAKGAMNVNKAGATPPEMPMLQTPGGTE
jgi:hypothetical protein